jgi:hypothetical protein
MKSLAGVLRRPPAQAGDANHVRAVMGVTPQPSWRSASSMTRVSSESSRSCTLVVPWHKAASSSTRLEMLLEPGSVTVPPALASGGHPETQWRTCGVRRRCGCRGAGRHIRPADHQAHAAARYLLFGVGAHAPVGPGRAGLVDDVFKRVCIAALDRSGAPWPAACPGRFWTATAILRGWPAGCRARHCGSLAAIRVKSRKPGPASDRNSLPCGWPEMPLMSAKAIRWGRWLTDAKAASCDSGDIWMTLQPRAVQSVHSLLAAWLSSCVQSA